MQIRQRFFINLTFGSFWYYQTVLVFFCFIASLLPLQAQSTVESLSFSPAKLPLANSKSYFILDVIDSRNLKTNQLGEIIVFGQPRSLQTNLPLSRELFSHWISSFGKRNEDCLPLEIYLEEVYVTEKRIAPNKVAGEMKVTISFQWRRSFTPLLLTSYRTSSTYTRPEAAFDHEALLRRLLDGSIKHFDQWYGTNEFNNPLLARGVKLVFEKYPIVEKNDTIFYTPTRKLTWNDFQGNHNRPGSKYAAAVFTSMSYEGSAKMVGNYLQATLTLKVFLVKSMSWGRPDARNDYTLGHEQTHFDITRIMAERFIENIKKLDLTIDDYDSQIQYQFIESFREMHEEQEKYDGQTRHGLNTDLQRQWNERIKGEIAKIFAHS